MTTTNPARFWADQGATAFDKFDPEWLDTITEPIDMGSLEQCVVGQWAATRDEALGLDASSYRLGLQLLGVDWPEDYGFDARYSGDDDDFDFPELNAAWQDIIDERRG